MRRPVGSRRPHRAGRAGSARWRSGAGPGPAFRLFVVRLRPTRSALPLTLAAAEPGRAARHCCRRRQLVAYLFLLPLPPRTLGSQPCDLCEAVVPQIARNLCNSGKTYAEMNENWAGIVALAWAARPAEHDKARIRLQVAGTACGTAAATFSHCEWPEGCAEPALDIHHKDGLGPLSPGIWRGETCSPLPLSSCGDLGMGAVGEVEVTWGAGHDLCRVGRDAAS